ncbi:MAG: GTP-binding protein [Rothia sp. (in: high G+C Gram-positive bacteria)]|nr:GTP-binding protein [Rothia sp. (in: high G+C Gram-positive bacteria)]
MAGMPLLVLSSASLLARSVAADALRANYPTAPYIQLDAHVENGAGTTITTRTYAPAQTEATQETAVYRKTQCTSCATRTHLSHLPDSDELVLIALPIGVSQASVVHPDDETTGHPITSCTLALIADDLEDDLWDGNSLTDRGLTGSCSDDRTPGEFLISELAYADTVISVSNSLLSTQTAQETQERTADLLSHLAPHAHLITDPSQPFTCAAYRAGAVTSRLVPGHLATCHPQAQEAAQGAETCGHLHGPNFTSAVLTADSILDTQALAQHLPHIVEGACRVRGHVWLTDHPQERVAVEGIGPTVWLQTCGEWGPDIPPRSIIVVTGDDLDPDHLQDMLNQCTIDTDALSRQLLH